MLTVLPTNMMMMMIGKIEIWCQSLLETNCSCPNW